MGQGIKGIIGIKGKIAIVLMLLVLVFSIFFLTNPRDNGVSGNIGKLQKSEKDNHYYISFLGQQDDKTIKLECTKKQYDFIGSKAVEYHIFYRLNFFNKKAGKILEVDDKPIIHGDYRVALYKEFKIAQS
jgi:hypothetical protein